MRLRLVLGRWLLRCRAGADASAGVQAVTDQFGKHGVIREGDLYKCALARRLLWQAHPAPGPARLPIALEPLTLHQQLTQAWCCSKHAEFALWAADVRKIDIGLLPKQEEKEMFKDFCEDFNTGRRHSAAHGAALVLASHPAACQ